MTMGNRHEYQALDWVKNELKETLKQAQFAIAAYEDDRSDVTRLQFCLTYMHQVRGTLEMVEVFGAALLARELERLTEFLNHHPERADDRALSMLLQGILQLPVYLERIQSGGQDHPAIIAPLIDEIRACRDAPAIDESMLFAPRLLAEYPNLKRPVPAEVLNQEIRQHLRRLRQMYQFALLGILRGDSIDDNLNYISKASARLAHLLENSGAGEFWHIVSTVMVAARKGLLPESTDLRPLLMRIERQLGQQIQVTDRGQSPSIDLPLLQHLLYYIARARPETDALQQLHDRFHLHSLEADQTLIDEGREKLMGPDKETINRVAVALIEDLAEIKESLDLYVRAAHPQPSALGNLVVPLKQISDTLPMLRLGRVKSILDAQVSALQVLAQQDKVDNKDTMDVAGALLFVESTLSSAADDLAWGDADHDPDHGRKYDHNSVDTAQGALIHEVRNAIEACKDAIVSYIGAQWDREKLRDVPHLLQQIEANLRIVRLAEPAQIITTLRHFVQRELLDANGRDPEWAEMDQVADALVGVDYYLERLSIRGHGQPDDDVIARARASMATLGYPVPAVPDAILPTTDNADADPGVEPDESADHSDLTPAFDSAGPDLDNVESGPDDSVYDLDDDAMGDDDPEFADTDELTFTHRTEPTPDTTHALTDDLSDELSDLTFSDLELETELDDADDEGMDFSSPEIGQPQPAPEQPSEPDLVEPANVDSTVDNMPDEPAKETAAAPASDDDDLIDDEIREIFLEEAEEVLETLNQWFPHYAADGENEEARTELRRAFHTLKGSGRMVRALVVGELAWAVENMLNRILDGSIETTQPVLDLLRDVIADVPALVDDFGQGRPSDTARVEALQHRAEALSRGEVPTLDQPTEYEFEATGPDPATDPDTDTELDSGLDPNTESDGAGEALAEAEASAGQSGPDSTLADDASDDSPLDETLTTTPSAMNGQAEPSGEDDAGRLRTIFEQEIDTHLNTLQAFVDDHLNDDAPALDDQVQRALHTIKGSAHMAGIHVVADMVSPLEGITKDVQSLSLATPTELPSLLGEMVQQARQQLADVSAGATPYPAPSRYFADVRALRHRLDEATTEGAGEDSLMSIFLNEAMNTVLGAEDTLREWQRTGLENRGLRHLQRDLITLADAARAIELLPLSALANQLILLYEHLQVEPPTNADHPAFDVLYRAHDAIIDMMDRLAAGQSVQKQPGLEAELARLAGVPVAGPEQLSLADNSVMDDSVAATDTDPEPGQAEADPTVAAPVVAEPPGLESEPPAAEPEPEPEPETSDESAQHPDTGSGPAPATLFTLEDHDPDILAIFLEEAHELLESVGEELDQWQQSPSDLTPVAALQRDLHTLKGGARMAEATPIAALAHELEFIYEAVSQGQLPTTAELLAEIQPAQDFLAQMVQDLTERQQCQTADALILQLNRMRTGKPASQVVINEPVSTADPAPAAEEETALDAVAKGDIRFTRAELDSLDGDILEVFIDEAVELIRDLDDAIHQWREQPSNELAEDEMKRVLHTLKGGARLARLPSLGTLSHDLETYVVRAQQTHAPLDQSFFRPVLTQYDQLASAIEQLQALMIDVDSAATAGSEPPAANAPAVADAAPEAEQREAPANRHQNQPVRRNTPQETVKVNASLLESLVNLAGESSIARARLEEQVNDLGFTLSDLDTTIERLRDRVRQLDQETETQVLFRQERAEESNYEDFDPLEMDRYSQIQQLSRSLMETSSDLLDLRTTLTNKSRDAETVLLQQSRIHTDLQEGLMQTRMVPFSRLVPRLRRIVRQVSNELHKSAEFDIRNAEGELDRSVLERMVSPLEHMLRNAVDHGLETPAERRERGKPETGQIALDLRREGGDVVLTLQDDGRGIAVDSVRQKAVANGLMRADDDLADHEILQFILTSGFSTAQKVTQLSGRGVGMDVVHNEVKALGGSMEIETQAGEGTRFIVRLPFTVSVNRALMVGAGEDIYAIPLNTIDGVARVQPTDLVAYLADDSVPFQYNGLDYRVQSLSQLIGTDTELHVEELDLPQPVILVKTLERQEPLALHVDRLLGSREIVVKTLGAQFATVPSVNGATILGDGSVVIILDLPALLRRTAPVQLPTGELPALNTDGVDPTPPRQRDPDSLEIMVIDDSVTVRKVTSRLLERNGMRVLTAKDGMDAMVLLQDHDPDLLLLDIEMPRMDGFEVANRVRHTERLKHIPIIMITSRTGQKHKDRAAEIGVNDYMGKPFQEAPLLAAIARLLGVEPSETAHENR